MAFDNRRPDRVAEAIREEVARFLAAGVKDPRVRGIVTVTGVDVTRDLRHAKVFVSVLGDVEERDRTLLGLESSHGVLQAQVARELRLRRTPTLEFLYDESIERGIRITELLEERSNPRGPAS